MSEVFDRLLCASANGVLAPIDSDDVRELIDFCESSPDRHPTPEGPFHLNESLTNRAFGGPEEGGWWYDTGRFVACHGTYPTIDEAAAARDAMASWLAERRRTPALAVDHARVTDLHHALRDTPVMANKVVETLSRIYNAAENKG